MSELVHPSLWKAVDRLSTFAYRWEHVSDVDPKMLTSSGFFYTHIEDWIKCWACGVVVTNLRKGLDADVIHARISPSCPHLLSFRGQEFIEEYNKGEVSWEGGRPICDFTPYKTAKPAMNVQQEYTAPVCETYEEEATFSDSDSEDTEASQIDRIVTPTPSPQKPTAAKSTLKNETTVPKRTYFLRSQQKCTHCYLHKKEVQLLPCKHSFCSKCANTMRKCYLCRRTKKGELIL